eukprot:11598106-Prorocentrum_lima.AAC.1
MTSSLVGSEMCIRDSTGPCTQWQHLSAKGQASSSIPNPVLPISWTGSSCLLYTSDAADDM